MRRLEGKRTIVTGAGSGIGRAIAHRFAAEGARVTLADVDEGAARKVAAEIGGGCLVHRTDVTVAEEVAALVRRAVEEWGGLDVMVNNAGVGVAATTPETSEEDFERVMDVCVRGTFLGMKYAIPAMRDSGGGAVINMSSIAALVGLKERAVYSAAKGAVLALTRAAAIDHVQEGVRVNAIAPGTVETPWISRITAGLPDPEEARRQMRARQPHGRFVRPEEVAAMAAYLASEEAASVVGACMVVDGGVTAG
ncbi:2,5-dichloro-2,5-cyclohexadiene-1,4-diol dehydrogenase [Rubrobacter xylanophilus DSM 9941]|uniref:SDR family NAD(P)-dependent oxidoreductase n=1 Tax=Rubrobacter xylanophilus TaxID=49319 RepID=UPI001C64288C|nr:glucose 1-dehydrogenase [Rubrobacter xylanophilus]QYJ16048.1 2,5-dichloro-2,5-cyclohexadiene-1,4-diol dehydrogenase [Rubrobacter xylanophilus DSM 9941]